MIILKRNDEEYESGDEIHHNDNDRWLEWPIGVASFENPVMAAREILT